MEHAALLNTLAQIALGVLGFTGIVVAFKHGDDDWTDYEKIRFQALVTTTLTAMFGALLPQTIAIATEDSSMVWRLANGGIGIMHLANFTAIIITAFRKKTRPAATSPKDWLDAIVGPSLIALHFTAAFGYIAWMELLLVIGVMQQLYIGISNFLFFVRWEK